MPAPRTTRRPRRLAAALVSVAAVAALLPWSPASAAPARTGAPASTASPAAARAGSDAGLFGSQDPTYDGVFRQSLALLALSAAGRPAPADAVAWLLRQQCPDGGFAAYRAPGKPCPATDVTAFTGEDSNSTATAAMALLAVRRPAAAARAVAWLRSAQNRDGGWGYVRGGGSDSNSTGLVLAALRKAGAAPNSVRAGAMSGSVFLRTMQQRCAAPAADRGALVFQRTAGATANALATAQAAVGLAGTLPVSRPARLTRAAVLSCAARGTAPSTATAAAGWLSAALVRGKGSIPDAYGSGSDWNTTAWAVLALTATRTGPAAVAAATAALQRNVKAFAVKDGAGRPAAYAMLVLVARATGTGPRSFGGTDLVAALLSTKRA